MGIIGLSDRPAGIRSGDFSRGLAEHRDLLEPGTAVLLFLSAEVQGDESARASVGRAARCRRANLHKGLRVFLARWRPDRGVASGWSRLRAPLTAMRSERGADAQAAPRSR